MRIATPLFSERDSERRLDELELLLAQPDDRERRPCPGCRVPCSCSGSPDCTCDCSATCAQAPRALSSDPETHPIEAHILPLVYALACVRLCPPCWSCEGHLDRTGGLARRPEVWFYSDAALYPHLIHDCIHRLSAEGALHHGWQVSLACWGHCFAPAFTIHPEVSEASPTLRSLWADIASMAQRLPSDMKSAARRLQARIA